MYCSPSIDEFYQLKCCGSDEMPFSGTRTEWKQLVMFSSVTARVNCAVTKNRVHQGSGSCSQYSDEDKLSLHFKDCLSQPVAWSLMIRSLVLLEFPVVQRLLAPLWCLFEELADTVGGPKSLASVLSQTITNDTAMSDLLETMIRSLWLMTRSEAIDFVGWLDQQKLHNRSRPRHLLWLMKHNDCCLVNLAVHRTKVFAEFEFLHEPIFGANFVIVNVHCACIRDFAYHRT